MGPPPAQVAHVRRLAHLKSCIQQKPSLPALVTGPGMHASIRGLMSKATQLPQRADLASSRFFLVGFLFQRDAIFVQNERLGS